MTIGPIGGRERRQIHLGHGVDHKPRQVVARQPLPHVRRQQKPLLTATLDEVLRHAGMLPARPDGPRLCDSLDETRAPSRARPAVLLKPGRTGRPARRAWCFLCPTLRRHFVVEISNGDYVMPRATTA